MTAIDFTDLPKRNKAYAGANGNKISVIYKDDEINSEIKKAVEDYLS